MAWSRVVSPPRLYMPVGSRLQAPQVMDTLNITTTCLPTAATRMPSWAPPLASSTTASPTVAPSTRRITSTPPAEPPRPARITSHISHKHLTRPPSPSTPLHLPPHQHLPSMPHLAHILTSSRKAASPFPPPAPQHLPPSRPPPAGSHQPHQQNHHDPRESPAIFRTST